MSMDNSKRALVLRAPGINCERETAHACRLVGFETELVHINQLLKAPESLLDYHFLVLPGGFSYGDDLGAGTLLAKNLAIHLGEQLRRFVEEGRPVLGICNGFQVLVRAGLLPGMIDNVQGSASLTDNASAQFECRWVALAPQKSNCLFTGGLERTIELPVAHGEGQFVFEGNIDALQEQGRVPLVYAGSNGLHTPIGYPDNPNGSLGNVAAVCNEMGNVFGLMPHPERYVSSLQHPLRRSGGAMKDGAMEGTINRVPTGDGLFIFKNAYDYVERATPVGARFIAPLPSTVLSSSAISYAASGVNIAAAEHAKQLMKDAVQATQGPEVMAGMGAFAGVFSTQGFQRMMQPALVASTDGVGTKTLIAAQLGRFDTIGYDLVNHSVNDLLTQGARPLFFMDYLAMGKLDAVQAAAIVQSVAHACREVGCTLLGGETAEMPDVYVAGAFDLAGTIVGVVEQSEMITGANIEKGDVLLGLPSSGLHTNGYSLVRRVFAPYALDTVFPELGEPLGDALLRPHRCYLREIRLLHEYLSDRGRFIKGIAHITGGGFAGNISRILPVGTRAVVETERWKVPPLFQLIGKLSGDKDLYSALNMGVGMVLVLSPKSALEARSLLPELLTVGYITDGEGVILK